MGISKDVRGEPELHRAVVKPVEQLKDALRSCPDVNAVDEAGQTALHVAVRTGDANRVAVLLEAGVDTRIRDIAGRTAHDIAVQRGNRDVAVLLKTTGTDCGLSR